MVREKRKEKAKIKRGKRKQETAGEKKGTGKSP